MEQTNAHYQYLILVLNDYLATLPESSRIAVANMAKEAMDEVQKLIEAVQILQERNKKLEEKLQNH